MTAVACCSQPSKSPPPSTSSRAATFSAAGVFGEVRRVCCWPILTPMAAWTASTSSSSFCPASVSVSSPDSTGVRSSSSRMVADWMSASAFWRRSWLLGVKGASAAIPAGVVQVRSVRYAGFRVNDCEALALGLPWPCQHGHVRCGSVSVIPGLPDEKCRRNHRAKATATALPRDGTIVYLGPGPCTLRAYTTGSRERPCPGKQSLELAC